MAGLFLVQKGAVVARDRDIESGGAGPRKDRTEDGLALVAELIEALTAAGNYMTAVNHIFGAGPRPAQNALSEALEKSLGQIGRANEAARLLRDFLRHQTATDDAGR
jgi:hypothetical protein